MKPIIRQMYLALLCTVGAIAISSDASAFKQDHSNQVVAEPPLKEQHETNMTHCELSNEIFSSPDVEALSLEDSDKFVLNRKLCSAPVEYAADESSVTVSDRNKRDDNDYELDKHLDTQVKGLRNRILSPSCVGRLTGSTNPRAEIASGCFDQAAVESLDSSVYQHAALFGSGEAERMERSAEALVLECSHREAMCGSTE